MATLLQREKHRSDHLLVGYGVPFQRVGQNVVDILDENHIGIDFVEIFEQSAVSGWAEQQRTILIAEGLTFGRSGDGIG